MERDDNDCACRCKEDIREECTSGGGMLNNETCECECPEGEVYIEETQACCPSARNCGHFCCGEGEYCASMDAVCCKTGQVLCGAECKDKPTPDASKCEKLSEDGCGIESSCKSGQTCENGSRSEERV
jgi:hypothetical protein